jgi:pyruvate dehydrogenase E2 component (dihydrolipoamide acetyltransferase)
VARVDIVMPQMGESIAEGTLSRWLKKVGDEVKRDEPLFEISTDKVDAEIPAPGAGVLAEILVQEGETVPVQAVVARLEKVALTAVGGLGSGAGNDAPTAVGGQETGAGNNAPAASSASTSNQAPAASAPAASNGAPAPGPRSPDDFSDRLRTKSSPVVRKIAAEHGIDISGMSGSGIQGRVTKKDILGAIESGAAPGSRPATPDSTAKPSMHAPHGAVQHGPAPQPWPGDVVEPMSRIRSLTADHMVASKHTNAHVTSFFEVDLTRVARIRAGMRKDFEAQSGQKLTFLPFILQAVTQTLKAHPVLNASVSGNTLIYRKQYNLGIAVALDWGLIVPVIKRADELSLTGLTRQLNDLATRARAKKLKPEEVQEATFTITNPGVFGSLMGTPIIPLGTTAILGLGAIEKRPKVITGADGEDTIAIRTCAYFSLSFDHRVVDGSDADLFLAQLKKTLETLPDPSGN